MDAELSLERFGLLPADAALPAIRDLLAGEAEIERTGGERQMDLALLCAVQLFSRGFLEDVLRIWSAKESGMDLGCSLDVQLLCGAGLERTKAFLKAQPGAAAAEALAYLVECEAAGDFHDFSPQAYLDDYRNYFGVGQ